MKTPLMKWKTFSCHQDDVEEYLNWLEVKGYEIYDIFYDPSDEEKPPFLIVAMNEKLPPKKSKKAK